MTTSKPTPSLSKTTKTNWWLDATVFLFALLSVISGAYFLFLPTGGYQGGRNPMYGVTILFTRENWDLLHMWGGVFMIIAVLIHALNLVLGAFSPTIHSLRLHYVEFFRKFYEGGGRPYDPFRSSLRSGTRM